MSDQLPIDFARTHARTNDPSTSHEAAKHIASSGSLGKVQRQVLDALRRYTFHGCVTGRELAELNGIDGAWKRLPDLERAGLAERVGTQKCTVTGRKATSWKATMQRGDN